MNVKKHTLVAVVITVLLSTGCFNKKIACEVNHIDLDSRLLGLERKDVIRILGEPNQSDLAIKSFEDYSYKFANKRYGLIVRYEIKNHNNYVTDVKCIKSNPRFEIFNRVIWH